MMALPLWVPEFSGWQADDWSAFGTCTTAGVAVVAAAVAWRQVREARRLREDQAQPYIAVYIETSAVSQHRPGSAARPAGATCPSGEHFGVNVDVASRPRPDQDRTWHPRSQPSPDRDPRGLPSSRDQDLHSATLPSRQGLNHRLPTSSGRSSQGPSASLAPPPGGRGSVGPGAQHGRPHAAWPDAPKGAEASPPPELLPRRHGSPI